MINLIISLWLIVVPIQWERDFENAKKTAKEKHELILLNFSGSDWCGPCILMKREYFENTEFTTLAENNLVLVNADFPRKKKNQLSDAEVKQNDMLAERYNKEGSFPLTLLLDCNGKVLKTWRGKPEATPEQWRNEIKTLCETNK